MRLEICHTTEYRYSEDAWDSHNEVNLYPTANERQHVRGFHLDVQPHATITTHPDYFGSLVHHVHVHERHRHLSPTNQMFKAVLTCRFKSVPHKRTSFLQ